MNTEDPPKDVSQDTPKDTPQDAPKDISNQPNAASPSYISNVSGDVGQSSGEMQGVILNGKGLNANQNSGTALDLESIHRAFDKISLEEQLDADKKAYELKPLPKLF